MSRLLASTAFALVLLLLACVRPACAADADGTPVETTLANGMHVVLVPDRLAPVVVTEMIYGAGSSDEPAPGIAHATEHMLFRGTSSLSASQLARIASRMGAVYNAGTTEQNTFYYYEIPSAYLDLVVRIEADRMVNATIADADWATERGAIEQEVRRDENVPGFVMGAKLRSAFLAGTPLAQSALGTIPSFQAMRAADIRRFYKRWYAPNNATFVVAGDLDTTAALARIRAAFEKLAPGEPLVHAPIVAPPLASSVIASTITAPVGVGAFEYRLPGAHERDFAAGRVLGEVFRGRRTELAALVDTGKLAFLYEQNFAFREIGGLSFFTVPARGDSVETALATIDSTLERYRATGIPAELVAAAQAQLLQGVMGRNASIAGLAAAYVDAAAYGIARPEDQIAALRAVDVDGVNRVLRSSIDAARRLTLNLRPGQAVATAPAGAQAAAGEHVGAEAIGDEPLPAWALAALDVPLRTPDAGLDPTQSTTLANGLRYRVLRESTAPTVVIEGVIRTNPLLTEPPGKDGIDAVLQGLMNFGTMSLSADAYQASLERIAAKAQLGRRFSLRVAPEHLDEGIALLADAIEHPLLPEATFAVVKEQFAQATRVAAATVGHRAARAQAEASYGPGDPRLREATEATIASLTIDDARRYHTAIYRPDETTIAIVGDADPARIDAAMKRAFATWRNDGPTPNLRFPHVAPRAYDPARDGSIVIASPAATQAQVTMRETFGLRRSDPEYVPLLIANTILSGEGTGSLLMRDLRTRRGYVYAIRSGLAVDETGATFEVSFDCAVRNERAARDAAIAVIRDLQTRPVTEADVRIAKDVLIARGVLRRDSYTGLADAMLDAAIDDGDGAAEWKALVTTTPAQVQHAMRLVDTTRFVRTSIEPTLVRE
jgi:zinc protease